MKAINRLKLIVFPVLSQFYCTQAALDFANSTTLLNEFTNFCYKRDLPRAMKAMNSMQNHGIYADCVTYSELIKCCVSFKAVEEGKLVHKHVLGKGYNPGTFLYNVLLHMYVKFNLLDEAQILFDQMHERNVVSWTTLISAFSNSKLNDRALGLLVLMGREGIWPNMFTYSSVLRACDDSWNLRQLHCSIVKVGFDSDVFVRSAMIDVYAKLGELENALAVFNEMVTGDLVVWNSIIGGFAQNSEGETALRLYKSMKRAGFLADESTLTTDESEASDDCRAEDEKNISKCANVVHILYDNQTAANAFSLFLRVWSLLSNGVTIYLVKTKKTPSREENTQFLQLDTNITTGNIKEVGVSYTDEITSGSIHCPYKSLLQPIDSSGTRLVKNRVCKAPTQMHLLQHLGRLMILMYCFL
ncbi:Pentatricopeptide repeat [Dillenia turbinata]|uniref:Pentatricopeptide repeat n=1 Tax=Dillenia turbinata TaxID=194707 RepID=A0AAN8W384_9MAGN